MIRGIEDILFQLNICTISGLESATHNHATVLHEMWKSEPNAERKDELSMCCSPTRLSAISMIYQTEDGQLIKTDLVNMVVEECGCS